MSDFKSRSGELKPREMMERAVTPDEISSEALLAILLKTGAPGCDVMELARRLLSVFGSLNELLTSDWRTLEERIGRHNADYPNRLIRGIGHVKCLELAAAFALGARALRLSPEELKRKVFARLRMVSRYSVQFSIRRSSRRTFSFCRLIRIFIRCRSRCE